MLPKNTIFGLVVAGGLLAAPSAEATGTNPCIGIGYRPAFSCGTTCTQSQPRYWVDANTVHLTGHDFERYEQPVVMRTDDSGREQVVASANVLSHSEVTFEVPAAGLPWGRIWLQDEHAVHHVNALCFNPDAEQPNPVLWEEHDSEDCDPITLCQSEDNSVLRTPDVVHLVLPLRAPTDLRAPHVIADTVWLEWSLREPNAVEVEFLWDYGNGWESLGTIPATRNREPIENLLPGRQYAFAVRAVGPDGTTSEPSNIIEVQTERLTVSYLDDANLPMPFYGTKSGQVLQAEVTGAWAIYDTNGDGALPYDFAGVHPTGPGNTSDVFPRYYDPRTCGFLPGAKFAPSTNTILLLEIRTFQHGSRPQFVAVHLSLNQAGWGGTMIGGDYLPSHGIVMGSAEVVQGELAWDLPSPDNGLGLLRGWIESPIFRNTCVNELYGTSVRVEIGGGVQIRDEDDPLLYRD